MCKLQYQCPRRGPIDTGLTLICLSYIVNCKEPHLYVSLAIIWKHSVRATFVCFPGFFWKHSVRATFGCFPGYYLETILQFSLYGWHQGTVWNTKGIKFYNNYILNYTTRIVGGPHPTHAIFCIIFSFFSFTEI